MPVPFVSRRAIGPETKATKPTGPAAAVAIAVSSTGAVQNLETHELIAPADLGGVLERAGTARGGYRPPGT